MKLRLGVLVVMWLVTLAGCERAPDTKAAKSYGKKGIAFDYPGNWSVTEDGVTEADPDVRFVIVESTADSLFIVQRYATGLDMSVADFADEFLATIIGEVDDMTVLGGLETEGKAKRSRQTATAEVMGETRVGETREFEITLLGETVPIRIRTFRVDRGNSAYVLIMQAPVEDWDKVFPGFALILGSLKLK